MSESTFGSPLSSAPSDDLEAIDVGSATRLLSGGVVALVTSTWRGESNVIPISWHTPLSSSPPLVGVSLEQSRYSTDMLSHAGEFVINIPPKELANHVGYLGSLSGEDVNKFEATQLETFSGRRVAAPLISDCCAWIECEIVERIPTGDHLFFIGLILSAQAHSAIHDGNSFLPKSETTPLHFLGGNSYSTLRESFVARAPSASDAPEEILQSMIEEDLELSREVREKKEEELGKLAKELEKGNVIDTKTLESELGIDLGSIDNLDLSKGIVLDDSNS
jgi:flavin reductase (DIM6/NTAB) family NADH-FMN oxidoreductase RutF